MRVILEWLHAGMARQLRQRLFHHFRDGVQFNLVLL